MLRLFFLAWNSGENRNWWRFTAFYIFFLKNTNFSKFNSFIKNHSRFWKLKANEFWCEKNPSYFYFLFVSHNRNILCDCSSGYSWSFYIVFSRSKFKMQIFTKHKHHFDRMFVQKQHEFQLFSHVSIFWRFRLYAVHIQLICLYVCEQELIKLVLKSITDIEKSFLPKKLQLHWFNVFFSLNKHC